MSEAQQSGAGSNPWKMGVIVGAIAAVVFLAGGVLAWGLLRSDEASALPSARLIEDCNRYAAQAERDTGRIVKDGAIGAGVGAGVGAASGAIANGSKGAGKGAGIGAILGATAGALYGLNEENKRTGRARTAYRECMARHGYE